MVVSKEVFNSMKGDPTVSTNNNVPLQGPGGTQLATSSSTVSPEQLAKFSNFLPEGKRSPKDYADELSKRGYWGASDMYKGAKDSAVGFAKDGRTEPDNATQNYNNNRKYSQLWHSELLTHVLSEAKRLGIKDKNTLIANKDMLVNSSRIGADNFNAISNQPAGAGETKGQNFFRVAGELYDELNKKEKANIPSQVQPNMIVNK